MSVSDINAARKWANISKDMRQRLLNNVFCLNCADATRIVKYDIHDDELGVVLKGQCQTCGQNVARVIEG
ncbi:hypothetical protein [Texcoconibacillus texcoconensis]|uniref:Uncharacterized protein n=1 Tax=Texcoconibacillus texcoconensis TaxID=1095777 RepID=A0A840QMD1_9BACI|nr:hypothetical protein [Texcoconibacillus texcoconensis]MBB5172516.1 hypothetical protein [Texcoconibacillus texcoconensis]